MNRIVRHILSNRIAIVRVVDLTHNDIEFLKHYYHISYIPKSLSWDGEGYYEFVLKPQFLGFDANENESEESFEDLDSILSRF